MRSIQSKGSAQLSTAVKAINQGNPGDQHPHPLRNVLQDDKEELVKVFAIAISENRLPIPEPTVFSGDQLKFNHRKPSFDTN